LSSTSAQNILRNSLGIQEREMNDRMLQGLLVSAWQARAAPAFRVLGVRINAVQIPDVIVQMESWIAEDRGCHFIAVTGMHGVTEAQHDPLFKQILNAADLVVPDGTPLVWLGRHYGYPLARRVYGPELMDTFCYVTASKYRHFLYGGLPGVPILLAGVLHNKFDVNIVGNYSPPFRSLSEEEDEEIVSLINAAKPDVLWVGLSTPKQERWMYEHRSKLCVPLVVGVGAAFDLNSGRIRQAPRWMREHGLEWFYRLQQEPRRLWRRYLLYGAEFLLNVGFELLNLRKYN
jgi:N-acetylglucosaminyldiphosphoundecaprenol N-acetyl-beta-D-mannosaminyltransferase